MYGTYTGETFHQKNGNACFLFNVTPMPPDGTWLVATQEQIDSYQQRHAAIWRVITNNLPLAGKAASRLRIYDESVIRDVGIACLLRCVKSFDATRGFKFSTYAYTALRRDFTRHKYTKYKHQLASYNEEGVIPKSQIELPFEHEVPDLVQYTLSRLDAYDQIIIVMRFWKGYTYDEIARELGVSKGTVANEMRRVLGKCRAILDSIE